MKWSESNLTTAYDALSSINVKLNGNLKTMVGGTAFTITDGGNKYYGATHLDGSGVTFHVADSGIDIPLTNFLHESGHLFDLRPATKDVFSGSLPADPTWVKDGYVNSELLLGKLTQPVQAKYIDNEDHDPYEYWADAFANYMGDNINLNDPAGAAMATDVYNALKPYITP